MPTLADFPRWFLVATAVLLGLTFGSFLNVVIHRLPRGESVVSPGSRCPKCGKPIRALDNVPVVGWLVLLGRARCCGAKISPRYPLVEALGGLTAWAVLETRILSLPLDTSALKLAAMFFAFLALALGLIATAFIDLEYMIVPDEVTIGGSVLALATVGLRSEITFLESLIGLVVGFVMIWLPFDLLYRLIRGQTGMAMGDAKLTMLAGAWFGWKGAVFALLAGAIQGTVGAIAIYLARGKIEEPEAVKREREEMLAAIAATEDEDERKALEAELAADPVGTEPSSGFGKSRLAFGPFLALATLEYLLFGPLIVAEVTNFLYYG